MKRIYLSKDNRKIYGVCGGIGEALEVDPTLVRVIVILGAAMTAFLPAISAYLLCAWFIIPHKR